MRVIGTGAGGLIGWHLADELARRGETVRAWMRSTGKSDWNGAVYALAVDICDRGAVSRQLADFAPELIVHLAAQSFPGKSWDEPAQTFEVNVGGVVNLLDAARRLERKQRIL